MSSGYSKSGLSEWIITFKPWLLPRIQGIGHVEPFQLGVEDWDQYTERLEQYYIANEIAAEKNVAVLLTMVGAKTYSLLRDLIAPTKPATKTYEEFVAVIKTNLKPKPLIIASSTVGTKEKAESISQYMAELRKLVDSCQFTEYLEEALCDRLVCDKLVCGLCNEVIQRRLLTWKTLHWRRRTRQLMGWRLPSSMQVSCKH